jgi:hypothetical protein
MRRVFGAKKDKEPPPSIQDASEKVIYLSFFLFLEFSVRGSKKVLNLNL